MNASLFGELPTQVSIERQIVCVERELKYRAHVYQRRVQDGKLNPALETLKRVQAGGQ